VDLNGMFDLVDDVGRVRMCVVELG
jgi:hypothetical protein